MRPARSVAKSSVPQRTRLIDPTVTVHTTPGTRLMYPGIRARAGFVDIASCNGLIEPRITSQKGRGQDADQCTKDGQLVVSGNRVFHFRVCLAIVHAASRVTTLLHHIDQVVSLERRPIACAVALVILHATLWGGCASSRQGCHDGTDRHGTAGCCRRGWRRGLLRLRSRLRL